MGIRGLWEVIEPAATEVHLLPFALANRYQGAPPHVPFMIGIDASVWFEQCQQQMWYRAHPQSGQNPALRTFLFRLARLARLPVHLVFCYDGNKRPTTKRHKQVKMNDHWMTRPTQRILDAFNVPWLVAPAEAEAQLAYMNKSAIIDAVMTDDSDVFVFGAHTVLRNSSLTDGDSIKVYTTSAIKQRITPHLHDEAFAVMALCCGGDYDEGLRGCGTATALGLVQCGVGDQLREVLQAASVGVHGMPGPPEPCVFDEWRQDLRHHLVHDPRKSIRRSCPTVAASVSDSFPPPDVVKLYLDPAITTSVDVPYVDVPRPPDLPALASLVRELLGWEDKVKILRDFRSKIWPVVVLKEVLMDLRRIGPNANELDRVAGCTRAAFLSLPQPQTDRHGVRGRVLPVPTNVFVKETLAAPQMRLQDEEVPPAVQSKLQTHHHGQEAGAGGSGGGDGPSAVIDLTGPGNDPPVSLGVIDLTHDDDY